jgi:acetyl esterase/lipase
VGFKNLTPQSPIYPEEAASYAVDALSLSEAAAVQCNTMFDIPYGDHPDQQLDLYLPDNSLSSSPVLIFAHGGAWTHGYKEWMGLMAPPLLGAGVILVSVSYRLAPDHKFPAALDDCLAALAWTHRNIAAHGGDPHRISVGGHSAGGHLYALAAVRRDLHARFKLPESPVVACLPVSGQMNMMFAQRTPGSPEARLYETFLADDAAGRAASPVNYVWRDMPYFLLAYGSADFARIIKGNRDMATAMTSAGAAFDELVFEGYDHFRTALELRNLNNPWVRRVTRLLTTQSARRAAE